MNKDESERCYEKAQELLSNNQILDAKKWVEKSLRLYNSEKGFKLLSLIDSKIKNGETSKPSQTKSAQSSTSQHQTNDIPKPQYTKEQAEISKKILQTKNYYEVLGCSQNSSEDEIKKSYKKLALKLHPDKNKSPDAMEAFKHLARAYDCLTNQDKRDHYNRYGSDEQPTRQTSYYNSQQNEFDAEDIFDLLFNQHRRQQQQQYRYQQNQRHHNQQRNHNQQGNHNQQQNQKINLMGWLPFLFIFLSFFGQLTQPESLYSYNRTNNHPIVRNSQNLKNQYYVNEEFFKKDQHFIKQIDKEIDSVFYNTHKQNCERQKYEKQRLIQNSRFATTQYYKNAYLKEAEKIDSQWTYCNDYQNYHNNYMRYYS